MSKRLWPLTWMVVACLLVMPIAATRANAYEEKMGSIIMYMSNDDEGTDRLEDGEIALYRVASVSHVGRGGYDVSGGQFASSPTVADIPNMSKQELDRQNAKIAAILEQEALTQGIEPMEVSPIAGGFVDFPEVPEGLYLLFQTVLSEDGRKVNPFLMSVPDENGEYVIDARPKPGVPKKTTPGTEEDPTPGHDPHTINPEEYYPDIETVFPGDNGTDDRTWTVGDAESDGSDHADDRNGSSMGTQGSGGVNGSGGSGGSDRSNGSGGSTSGTYSSGDDSHITLRVPQTSDQTVSPVLVIVAGVLTAILGLVLRRSATSRA
ncbi:MAG: hypothetical protein IKG22_03610 [Atopobiaceae bacterium]|nr:hypothetical protein [Atopobiaceae bacterium]